MTIHMNRKNKIYNC